VVDVRLFKNASFASANLMMLVLGIALYGSTVLLPLYLQIWMGYSAQQAGMVLSPGGVAVILLLPFVGRLVGKYDARYLLAFGFAILSLALYHMARTIHPGMDFSTAVWLRIYQAAGLAFLFVPINTIVYGRLIREAQTLAYLDVLLVFSVFTALMVPLVFLIQRPKPGAAPAGH